GGRVLHGGAVGAGKPAGNPRRSPGGHPPRRRPGRTARRFAGPGAVQPALPPAAGGRRLPGLAHVPAGQARPGPRGRAVDRRQSPPGLPRQAQAAVRAGRAGGRHAEVRRTAGHLPLNRALLERLASWYHPACLWPPEQLIALGPTRNESRTSDPAYLPTNVSATATQSPNGE